MMGCFYACMFNGEYDYGAETSSLGRRLKEWDMAHTGSMKGSIVEKNTCSEIQAYINICKATVDISLAFNRKRRRVRRSVSDTPTATARAEPSYSSAQTGTGKRK